VDTDLGRYEWEEDVGGQVINLSLQQSAFKS
jgi:hypothetical protein